MKSLAEDDLLIKMLRFGKSKIESGFRYHDLVSFLQKNGFPNLTDDNYSLRIYFQDVFFSANGYTIDHSSFFFITPESYFQLLDYDKMNETRKASRQANIIAIFAIVLTLVSLLVSIFK